MNKDSSLSEGFVGMFKGGRPCGGTPEGGSVQRLLPLLMSLVDKQRVFLRDKLSGE